MINSPSFFLDSSDCDPGYINVRDKPDLCGFLDFELKKYIESLWKTYAPFADNNFRQDACKHFQERFWEMYLGVTFIKQGFTIQHDRDEGPDFYLSNTPRKIWIEAIAPGPGDGNDAVPAPKFDEKGISQVSDAPIDQYILRLRHAIEEKKKKYETYIKTGIVGSGDVCIIAINTKRIARIPWDFEMPSILKAVYPFGPKAFEIDRKTGKLIGSVNIYRDAIQKKNGSDVSTNAFLDPDYGIISAVIDSNVDCANKPDKFGKDFFLVHNGQAKNKLEPGTFKFGTEYVPEDTGDLRVVEHC